MDIIHTGLDRLLPNLPLRLLLLLAPAVLLSVLLVRRMIGLAVMDMPVGRSAHEQPTPRGGGVGMVACVLLGVPAALSILPSSGSHLWAAVPLLSAVALLAAVSWLDDLRQLPPLLKLAAQGVSAALCVLAALAEPAGTPALLPSLAPKGWSLAVFCIGGFGWVMLCTNAVNFMDGLNGLASGVCALCGLFAVPLGLVGGDPLLSGAGLMLFAGLLGFLPFNFPRARIFMGDVGSQVCGLLVGSFSLLLLADTGRITLALSMPLMLTGILLDVLFTLVRRLRNRERITQAHRGHLYQVAYRSGLSRVTVTLMHWGFAIWGLALSLALLPERPLTAAIMAILPQFSWAMTVRQRAARAGLAEWS
ncbi:hypothetical protein NFI95_01460 [Acetobacteraceae bacterium KSS8]|uniref:Uncharacterized protein n=1 Tax=Endosaccharibacter trunci TaxID=2812733 RepID=A0ABT1W2M7_9PROT|nr:hypothetical protein [Acetobacteraceae bacterium KSS8]